MADSGSILGFIIVSFAFSLILILKRDTLPANFKRPLALLALIMVSFSFFLIVYGFFSLK